MNLCRQCLHGEMKLHNCSEVDLKPDFAFSHLPGVALYERVRRGIVKGSAAGAGSWLHESGNEVPSVNRDSAGFEPGILTGTRADLNPRGAGFAQMSGSTDCWEKNPKINLLKVTKGGILLSHLCYYFRNSGKTLKRETVSTMNRKQAVIGET